MLSNSCDESDDSLRQSLERNGIDCEWVEALQRVRHYDIWINLNPMTAFNKELLALCDTNNEFKYLKRFSIDLEKSGYLLCFDAGNKIFFIIYKLVLHAEKGNNILDYTFKKQMGSLYKNVRDLLVIDPVNGNHEVAEWTKQIRDFCLVHVYQTYETIIRLKKSNLQIKNNSGYLVAFLNGDFGMDGNQPELNKESFVANNHDIDLVQEERDNFQNLGIISNQETQDLFLGWRHSTVRGLDQDKANSLLPLMIHLQCHYFVCHAFYKAYLEKLFSDIRYESKRKKKLEYYLNLFDQLVISFQNLYYLRERFLNDIKPIYREVYDKMESYWTLDKDYISIEKTISICKESVDRKMQITDSVIQNRQSNILFFLAIVQIFSFIGIFSDYFNFYKMDVIQAHLEEYSILKKYLMSFLFLSASLALIVTYSAKIKTNIIHLFRVIYDSLARH